MNLLCDIFVPLMSIFQDVLLTMLSALSVVSSREAAKHPSSVEPPSHIPANAAMLLEKQKTIMLLGEINIKDLFFSLL